MSKFKLTIENPVGPSELLLAALSPLFTKDQVDVVANSYTGSDVLETADTETGLEYRRYGRLLFEQIPSDTMVYYLHGLSPSE